MPEISSSSSVRSHHRLQACFLGLLIYCLFIILWGAWVRISGSGDGCGSHWPFCHGEIIPKYRDVAMLIENFHRLSSKAFGFFVIALWIAVFRIFKKRHPLRRLVVVCFVVTLIEGLLGAVLVLKGLVGQEESAWRAFVMALHLINTFLLTGSIVLCWMELKYPRLQRPRLGLPPVYLKAALAFIILWILVNSTGALAALASTLFPSTSLLEGWAKDFASSSHFSLRLRFLHPIFAVVMILSGIYGLQKLKELVLPAWQLGWIKGTQFLLASNLVVGIVTLGLLSPTVMKLIHLSFTHLIWISLVVSLVPLFRRFQVTQ